MAPTLLLLLLLLPSPRPPTGGIGVGAAVPRPGKASLGSMGGVCEPRVARRVRACGAAG